MVAGVREPGMPGSYRAGRWCRGEACLALDNRGRPTGTEKV